jgi:hypothetical protein
MPNSPEETMPNNSESDSRSMANERAVPSWLLNELNLLSGVFIDTTTVRGFRSDHGFAVATTEKGVAPAREITIDLTTRRDWDAIKKRLAAEGYEGY